MSTAPAALNSVLQDWLPLAGMFQYIVIAVVCQVEDPPNAVSA